MADERVLRDSKPIPHVYGAENVEQYDCTQIGDMVRRLESAQTWRCLEEDSLAWRASSDLLGNVATRIKTLAGELSRSWRGEDAAASQTALQRLEATARHLSERADSMRQFTEDSARIVQNAVTSFPWHGPGGVLGEIKGWVQDNPWAGFLSGNVAGVVAILGYNRVEEEFGLLNGYYRDALAALNEQYVEVNRTTLPYNVAVELPRIRPRQPDIMEDESLPGGVGGIGGIGGGPGGIGGSRLPTTDLSPTPSLPPPSGFDSAAIESPGLSGNPGGDGFGPGGPGTGGAPGDLPSGGLAGAGGPAGVGGLGPGGGAGLGGFGAGGGLGAGGTGAGVGGPGAGPGAGVGLAPGGIGAGGTGRGGSGAGPAGGGAGGRPGGGAPGSGATGAGGRAGMGGGMVPMGGAGRGGDDEKSSRTSWLVEDDDPWRGDEDDVPPPVLR